MKDNTPQSTIMNVMRLVILGLLFTALCFFGSKVKEQFARDWTYNFPQQQDQQIIRSFSQLREYLPDLPEDIQNIPYYTFELPEIVQRDIKSMRKNGTGWEISYQSENGMIQLTIKQDDGGLRVNYKDSITGYYDYDNEISDNITMFKDGENIVVYGCGGYLHGRYPESFELSETSADSESIAWGYKTTIDLSGADEGYEAFNGFHGEWMTLARNGNYFRFYRLGVPMLLGKNGEETAKFPGGDIVEFKSGYVLDSNKDLYRMYFCESLVQPWIHFQKVAEDIDEITDDTVIVIRDSRYMNFHIYKKDGFSYVSIPDLDTYNAYSYYSSGSNTCDGTDPAFKNWTYEIGVLYVEKEVIKEEPLEWCVYDIYGERNGGKEVICTRRRINGLDHMITNYIPEEERAKFDGLEIVPSQLSGIVEELKALYAKYEDAVIYNR